jgi:hypothetical protein
LKENVISGKLIPAGTGIEKGRVSMEQNQDELDELPIADSPDQDQVEQDVTYVVMSVAD